MAGNTKNTGQSGTGKEPLPFEQALQKLEATVEAMENGDLPLEQLLQQFEEGIRLVRICQTQLEEAELKIQKLEKGAGDELTLKPLKLSNSDD